MNASTGSSASSSNARPGPPSRSTIASSSTSIRGTWACSRSRARAERRAPSSYASAPAGKSTPPGPVRRRSERSKARQRFRQRKASPSPAPRRSSPSPPEARKKPGAPPSRTRPSLERRRALEQRHAARTATGCSSRSSSSSLERGPFRRCEWRDAAPHLPPALSDGRSQAALAGDVATHGGRAVGVGPAGGVTRDLQGCVPRRWKRSARRNRGAGQRCPRSAGRHAPAGTPKRRRPATSR